jgi:hypothetical protein
VARSNAAPSLESPHHGELGIRVADDDNDVSAMLNIVFGVYECFLFHTDAPRLFANRMRRYHLNWRLFERSHSATFKSLNELTHG